MAVVLVTGASRGIGVATALAFARAGDRVYASMRDLSASEPLQRAAETEKLDLNCIALDVTRPASFATVIDTIVEAEGRLDILVNNAAILSFGAFEDVRETELRRVMETNFFGPALLTQAVLPQMRAQNGGYIIMLSSLSGVAARALDSVYAASKFALEGLTEGLRNEVARWNIKTALIEPALYATEIFKTVAGAPPVGSAYKALVEQHLNELEAGAAQGRAPSALADLIVNISRSDGSRFRWQPEEFAEGVVAKFLGLGDDARSRLLREISDVDWWIDGRASPK